jgi:hypothetical protein
MSKQDRENLRKRGADEAARKVTRRDAVKKMGKYAAYTAPTLTVLLTRSKTVAASGPPT